MTSRLTACLLRVKSAISAVCQPRLVYPQLQTCRYAAATDVRCHQRNSSGTGNRSAPFQGPSTSTQRRFTGSSRDSGLMLLFCSSQPHRPRWGQFQLRTSKQRTTRTRKRSHGQKGTPSSPAVSGRPQIRFAFCTAWPAAPLPRLSTTPIAITKLRSGSAA